MVKEATGEEGTGDCPVGFESRSNKYLFGSPPPPFRSQMFVPSGLRLAGALARPPPRSGLGHLDAGSRDRDRVGVTSAYPSPGSRPSLTRDESTTSCTGSHTRFTFDIRLASRGPRWRAGRPGGAPGTGPPGPWSPAGPVPGGLPLRLRVFKGGVVSVGFSQGVFLGRPELFPLTRSQGRDRAGEGRGARRDPFPTAQWSRPRCQSELLETKVGLRPEEAPVASRAVSGAAREGDRRRRRKFTQEAGAGRGESASV